MLELLHLPLLKVLVPGKDLTSVVLRRVIASWRELYHPSRHIKYWWLHMDQEASKLLRPLGQPYLRRFVEVHKLGPIGLCDFPFINSSNLEMAICEMGSPPFFKTISSILLKMIR